MEGPEIIGRYALYGAIASGGMATVHLGRLLGPVGFSRTVAIKRMHPHFTGDPEFVSMFLDEARLAARIRHPNVVSTLDVVATSGELFLVLEYVQGGTLAVLDRRARTRGHRIPVPIAASIMSGVLHGLHAAHEATNERGEALGIVHRDISPENVMVGLDGVARVLDFGVAKAAGRLRTTNKGTVKGKLPYMAPEQLRGLGVSRRCDIYAAGVVLWEVLTGRALFYDDVEAAILAKVLTMHVQKPGELRPDVSPALDEVILRALSRDPEQRFATAREMATALEAAVQIAIAPAVGAWVEETAADAISTQAQRVAEIELASDGALRAAEVPPVVLGASADDTQQPAPPPLDSRQLPTLVGVGPVALAARPVVQEQLQPAGLPAPLQRRTAVGIGASILIACVVALVVLQRRAPEVAGAPVASTTPSASVRAPEAVAVDSGASTAPSAYTSAPSIPATGVAAAPQPQPQARPRVPPKASVARPPVPSYNPRDHL